MSALPGTAAATSAALRSFETAWRARPADPLATMRAQSMHRFLALGLPTGRDESWRYTNLRAIAARSFVDAPRIAAGAAAAQSWLAGPGMAVIRIVNGYPEIDDAAERPDAAFAARSLGAILAHDPGFLAARLAPVENLDEGRWALLNRALFVDGLYLRITGRVAEPILIVHSANSAGENCAIHSRLIVEAAPGAEATIIEHHLGPAAHPVLANRATQIDLEAGAAIEHFRVFSGDERTTHFDALDLRQAADSRCRQFTIVLGGALVRTNLRARLGATGATHDSYALLVGHDARHVDCVNTIVHAASRTHSTQTARAIGAGTSRVVFNSKVIVDRGTVGAQSRQSCRSLLLSPTAEVDTRPQLEIHADDVQCAHGATTGRLDPDMLFYLLSRGIERPAAQSLLIYAFLDDVLTGISSAPARRAIEDALIAQLPDADLLRTFR